MNKNLIIVLIVVGVLVLAGIGYAVWSNYNSPEVAVQIQNVPSQDSSNPQVSSPVVQTNSNTAPYISTVVVSGTVNPKGSITKYWYEYGKTSTLDKQTRFYLVGSGYINFYTPAYITGLLPNTEYFFRLSASNLVGTTNGSIYSFKTNNTPDPSGVAPIANTFDASSITKTTADLNGKINPKDSVTTYWFEYGLTSNLGTVTSFQTSSNSNSLLNVLVSVANLQPSTKYYFRINAQNQFETVNGQILNFTTNGPADVVTPIIKNNSVTAITSTSAKLNASVNPNGAITTYWFEYSINSSLSPLFNTSEQSLGSSSLLTNVSADINNLTNNTKYYVKVVAKNQYGTVRSDAITFTTKK
jgi:phosphodiesterase/alkaline phosphatase D-like protein